MITYLINTALLVLVSVIAFRFLARTWLAAHRSDEPDHFDQAIQLTRREAHRPRTTNIPLDDQPEHDIRAAAKKAFSAD